MAGPVPPPGPAPRFPNLRPFLTQVVTIVLAVIAARYGIPIPPPVVPPGAIPPPQVIVPPPGELQPPPIQIPQPMPNPPGAITRIQFGRSGCSATIIGPRRVDGRWWVLTAAHCIERIGQTGVMKLLDGRTVAVSVVSFHKRSDAAWLQTETRNEEYPYAFLAASSPPVGAAIWHAGYGVDKPGNRELGKVAGLANEDGQLRFILSVSSGDSGGGIVLDERGYVVSCVCCTTERGRVGATTWGASPEAALAARPTTFVSDPWPEWTPLEVPIKPG